MIVLLNIQMLFLEDQQREIIIVILMHGILSLLKIITGLTILPNLEFISYPSTGLQIYMRAVPSQKQKKYIIQMVITLQ
jgi:hypothetical protein